MADIALEEDVDGSRADVEAGDHLDDDHDDDHDECVCDARFVIVSFAEIFGECVDVEFAVDGKEEVAEHEEADDGGDFEVTLCEADGETDAHHADDVVGGDV